MPPTCSCAASSGAVRGRRQRGRRRPPRGRLGAVGRHRHRGRRSARRARVPEPVHGLNAGYAAGNVAFEVSGGCCASIADATRSFSAHRRRAALIMFGGALPFFARCSQRRRRERSMGSSTRSVAHGRLGLDHPAAGALLQPDRGDARATTSGSRVVTGIRPRPDTQQPGAVENRLADVSGVWWLS